MKKNIIFATAGILAVALTAAAIWAFSEDKTEESAEAKPEPVETPEGEEYTDWAEVEDPDETDATLNIVEVVDRKPGGLMVAFQKEGDIDIYRWTQASSLEESELRRQLFQHHRIDPASVIEPKTFSPDVRAIHRELVTAANGYTIELAMFMDYVISGNFAPGDAFIEECTGMSLENLIGTDAYQKLRVWASKPTSLTLLGNMVIIQRWLQYCPDVKVSDVTKVTLHGVADLLQSMSHTDRYTMAHVHYLTRYLPAEDTLVVDFVKSAHSRKTARASINTMRKAGVRDGGVFDYYGDGMKNFSENELISVLEVLGKFTPTTPQTKAAISRYAARK